MVALVVDGGVGGARLLRRVGLTVAFTLMVAPATPAAAQRSADSSRSVASDGEHFRRRDALTLSALAIAAGIAYHNDRGIEIAFQRPGLQGNETALRTAAVFRVVGQPGVIVGSVSAYAFGRLARRPTVAAIGLRTTEAIIVTAALTSGAKYVVGRARPRTTPTHDPYDFQLWRGGKAGYTSMPSGHTSAAFATASALAVEWRAAAPGSARIGVPLLYTGATLVGLSRIYNDRHWGSDVMAAAALGTLTGSAVTRWGRAHPQHRLQRLLLPVSVSPDVRGGVQFGVSFTLGH
jgi:membrane-associated phospholipid phosphatase